eukprot:CAMPEP_0170327590 /NCGR_PEP_ID=MMETSP0116_2-20130129/64688_1 /TAXON_ID=400756 /ORGANISM="Durinskia baltica, Strain CSIRO CS-38" /LENGTH=193 /DNA_ID=CAMNT_0010580679 /DNA_START=9 /DNA_END=586 /DNA_ORIENTATION=-
MMAKGMMGMMGKSAGGKGSKGGKVKGPKAGTQGNIRKLFVGGLTKQTGEQAIKDFFSQFGAIKELKMINDDAGISKGYCFVTFEDIGSSKLALDNYESNIIGGKWVDVKPSEWDGPKPGDWYCPNCGDVVFAKRDKCNMCGFHAGGMAQQSVQRVTARPGDWNCPSCGDLVFATVARRRTGGAVLSTARAHRR